jgi:hypothetical protein
VRLFGAASRILDELKKWGNLLLEIDVRRAALDEETFAAWKGARSSLPTPSAPRTTPPPMRASSAAARSPSPVEISLVHHGVLFLDELPEFKGEVLEVMRQPLEDGKLTISKAAASLTYPAHCALVDVLHPA